MVEYSIYKYYIKASIKLSDSQLNKLESAIKNHTGLTSRMSMEMFGGNELPHELLLTTRQKRKLRNAFENNMTADIKLSKTWVSKIIQSGGFLYSLLSKIARPFGKTYFSSIRNKIRKRCRNSKSNPKKIHSSRTTALIIANEEINDIIKILQAPDNSDILLQEITKAIENETL